MNKIEFPRIGVDGEVRSKDRIEKDFFNMVEKLILKRLEGIKDGAKFVKDEVDAIEYIMRHLREIILALPDQLKQKECEVGGSGLYIDGNGKQTPFGKKILDAFHYSYFRENMLVKLANWLNIKCCPYCNQHYTLYVNSRFKKGIKHKALFQFDHFYSKNRYPYLSMSLYNLIPCCQICNHEKSVSDLPIQFNPYYGEIASYFTFKVVSPLSLKVGSREDFEIDKEWNDEQTEVKMINEKDRNAFDDMTHLKEQYKRHRDVAEEVYAKAYLEPYYHYPSNFKGLSGFTQSLRQRVMHGTYMDPKDIDKRPLTKLYQDLWKQARGIEGIE